MNLHRQSLAAGIAERSAQVCTVGLGYVGLPLALTINEAGFRVIGFDVDSGRVARINRGEQVISYLPDDRIADAVAGGRFRATDDPAQLADADIILICVPTPLTRASAAPARDPAALARGRVPDLSYMIRAAEEIARWLRPAQMIVLESTVWPGGTREVLQPILEKSGLVAGFDFFLGFSPEREDPGNAKFSTRDIPKLVGADDADSRELLERFYSNIVSRAVPLGSTATAEAAKLVENTFRNVNIALANELKVALGAMGVDVWAVIEAAATKPFGFMPFYPGPGVGGDCIPVSPAYLAWRAGDLGTDMPIVRLAREANEAEPARIAGRIGAVLAERGGGADGAGARPRILILGIAYKKDVEDTRESPALELIAALEANGADVDYHDPFFPLLPLTRDYPGFAGRRSIALGANVADYDAVVIATDHSEVDYALIASHARLIIDTRNTLAKAGVQADADRFMKL